jgi:glucosamine 6-phosphate synthetase-like amidotransferase/phosphosugar isomerase protein
MHSDDAGLDLMEADVRREGAAIRDAVPALRGSVAGIAGAVPARPTRVYLIGCGDSLDGGIAARFVWDRMMACPVEAVPAMTFATSVVEDAPEGSLVVALSQSGKVSRVIEGVRSARARGLGTITITASSTSPLAQEPADATWLIPFDKLGAVPGTTSHILGTVAFYELGCALAEDGSARDRVRSDLGRLGDLIDETLAACVTASLLHADAMAREHPVLLLGYGPVLSSARFTVRKLLELTQLIALWQETEEYAHDEYSLVGPGFRVMQFCPPDRGGTRNAEVARYLQRLGVHLTIVADGSEAEAYGALADIVYPMPACPPSLVPLLYALPGQSMSIATARRVGGSLYGMAERVHKEDGDPQIYESAIATATTEGTVG